MRKEILTEQQTKLLPLIGKFSKDFGLVGGTAIALHIGHRESIDFDLFTVNKFDSGKIKRKITNDFNVEKVFVNEADEYTVLISGVKITFLHYPFNIEFKNNLDNVIKVADLLTLAAMKAYALGRRAKWKDYVDMYFIFKNFHSIAEVIGKAGEIFSSEFNEKIFRAQLAYFEDIDYTEQVVYRKGFEVDDDVVKTSLIDFSLSFNIKT
ncbi:MAG: hypothetical protein UT71_C0009G0004 [Parcubacteria group bacterium GW2011_GWF2_40_10]|nr:MAG: hypothetical protein UT71_C0009G0004 [Parcubacteria group bacterium GW2011_GWF2_40_10]KKR76333.1 MAG: hypothetical protein UU20_C0027G0005 [Parcubacteria group bacterium GW2011_GWE2_40_8]HBB56615.1 hypothetical protein [Patescibacteria group bacterium]